MIRTVGRKTNEWAVTIQRIKKRFSGLGIERCELGYEGCWRDNALSIAHGKKRRKLGGDELETLTILACIPCHQILEAKPPEAMLAKVRSVISERGSR